MSELETAYQRYCEAMKFEPSTWRSILGFSHLVGVSVLNAKKIEDEPNERIKSIIKSINGPHGMTVLEVHKVQRYTITGRITAITHKLNHTLYILYLVIKDTGRRFKPND